MLEEVQTLTLVCNLKFIPSPTRQRMKHRRSVRPSMLLKKTKHAPIPSIPFTPLIRTSYRSTKYPRAVKVAMVEREQSPTGLTPSRAAIGCAVVIPITCEQALFLLDVARNSTSSPSSAPSSSSLPPSLPRPPTSSALRSSRALIQGFAGYSGCVFPNACVRLEANTEQTR